MKNIILENTSNCVDRDIETNEIIQDIVNTDKSTIRLIYSKTAIGGKFEYRHCYILLNICFLIQKVHYQYHLLNLFFSVKLY